MKQKCSDSRRALHPTGVSVALIALLHLFVLVQRDTTHTGSLRDERQPFIDQLYHHHLLDFLAFYGRNGGEFRSGLFREENESPDSVDSSEISPVGSGDDVESIASSPVPVSSDEYQRLQSILNPEALESWFPGVVVRVSPEGSINGGISELRFDFEFLSDVFGGFGRAHLSLRKTSGGAWIMTVHHAELPRGRRLARQLLDGNLALLRAVSDHPESRVELEAVTNHKGLSGALGWARYPFGFKPGEGRKLKRQFSEYLRAVCSESSPEAVERWVSEQNLTSPSDYFSLSSAPFLSEVEKTLKRSGFLANVFEKRIRRHFKKYDGRPGQAFLSDPKLGVSYHAQLFAAQESRVS